MHQPEVSLDPALLIEHHSYISQLYRCYASTEESIYSIPWTERNSMACPHQAITREAGTDCEHLDERMGTKSCFASR